MTLICRLCWLSRRRPHTTQRSKNRLSGTPETPAPSLFNLQNSDNAIGALLVARTSREASHIYATFPVQHAGILASFSYSGSRKLQYGYLYPLIRDYPLHDFTTLPIRLLWPPSTHGPFQIRVISVLHPHLAIIDDSSIQNKPSSESGSASLFGPTNPPVASN